MTRGTEVTMIHVVIGTKAQLVKMAPVMAELQRRGQAYNFIFTGQHRETMDALRDNFAVKEPDVVLYRGSDITSVGRMLLWMLRILSMAVFRRRRIFAGDPGGGVVLVHGDTFSTLLGAMMGRLAGHRVAHVESGLRSFDLFHPFPEELTRLATFCLAHVYFCPGEWAVRNLARFRGEKVDTRFNTLLDALRDAVAAPPSAALDLPDDPYCVATMHRFENLYSREVLLRNIELIELAATRMRVLFIMHPVTRRKLEQFALLARLASHPGIELRPRYDYFDFMQLVRGAAFMISDGGSNQEECFYLGKPCILLRRTSERREGLGHNVVLSNYDRGVFERFLDSYQDHATPGLAATCSPSAQICDYLQAREVSAGKAGQ